MDNLLKLSKLKRGELGIIYKINAIGKSERKLKDLGFVNGEKIEVVNIISEGRVAVLVKGAKIALDNKIAENIFLKIEDK